MHLSLFVELTSLHSSTLVFSSAHFTSSSLRWQLAVSGEAYYRNTSASQVILYGRLCLPYVASLTLVWPSCCHYSSTFEYSYNLLSFPLIKASPFKPADIFHPFLYPLTSNRPVVSLYLYGLSSSLSVIQIDSLDADILYAFWVVPSRCHSIVLLPFNWPK